MCVHAACWPVWTRQATSGHVWWSLWQAGSSHRWCLLPLPPRSRAAGSGTVACLSSPRGRGEAFLRSLEEGELGSGQMSTIQVGSLRPRRGHPPPITHSQAAESPWGWGQSLTDPRVDPPPGSRTRSSGGSGGQAPNEDLEAGDQAGCGDGHGRVPGVGDQDRGEQGTVWAERGQGLT